MYKLGNINFVFIILNTLFFSFIFWFLTFLSKYFYQDKYSNYKLNFYECGFKSLSNVRLNISVQYFLIAIFLILYDSEFILLFSIFFSSSLLTSTSFFLFLFFLFFLLITLVIDYIYSALEWNI